MFYMRADTPYKSVGEIIRAKQPPQLRRLGNHQLGLHRGAKILELAVGAKINSVSGYQGGSDADLAVEKGEIVCRAHTLASHFGREPFNSWHKKGFDLHLLQSGRKRDPRARRRRQLCMRYWRNLKFLMESGASPRRCCPAVNSAVRCW